MRIHLHNTSILKYRLKWIHNSFEDDSFVELTHFLKNSVSEKDKPSRTFVQYLSLRNGFSDFVKYTKKQLKHRKNKQFLVGFARTPQPSDN